MACAMEGGCPSDYIAIAISFLSLLVLFARATLPFIIYKIPVRKISGFWLLIIQVLGSIAFLLSLVMAINFVKLKRRHMWQSCYVWAVWVEGPFGFGLLLSCRIVQAFELYNLFVKRRLLPIKSCIFLPLILLPWIGASASYFLNPKFQYSHRLGEHGDLKKHINTVYEKLYPKDKGSDAFGNELIRFMEGRGMFGCDAAIQSRKLMKPLIHIRKPLNSQCHMRSQWVIPIMCLHALYIVALIGITSAIRHIEFRFREFKDLLFGIISSSTCVGIWIAAYILNEVYDDTPEIEVISRFVLLVMASILVLFFFSISTSQPLLSQMSLTRRDAQEFETMGRALGIPDSGQLLPRLGGVDININEPLDKLLLDKRFRHSFMAFADSCLAGESVHFYDEVHELGKIPVDDPVRRVYMARHIIEKYIISGAEMEVNISHRTRQEILGTLDLAHPDLFNRAMNELMQLIKTNLARDYLSSMFFMKFKEESKMLGDGNGMEHLSGWDFSPRLSSVHCTDDPFDQENPNKDFSDCKYDICDVDQHSLSHRNHLPQPDRSQSET